MTDKPQVIGLIIIPPVPAMHLELRDALPFGPAGATQHLAQTLRVLSKKQKSSKKNPKKMKIQQKKSIAPACTVVRGDNRKKNVGNVMHAHNLPGRFVCMDVT